MNWRRRRRYHQRLGHQIRQAGGPENWVRNQVFAAADGHTIDDYALHVVALMMCESRMIHDGADPEAAREMFHDPTQWEVQVDLSVDGQKLTIGAQRIDDE